MEIVLFCTSRTAAREKAKEVQGKVKDMGPESKSGERWAVLYEVPDDIQVPSLNQGKSEAIQQQAKENEMKAVDIPLSEVQKDEFKGIPVWVEDQTVDPVLVELANKELLQAGIDSFMDRKIEELDVNIPQDVKIVVAARETLKSPCKPKGKSNIRTGMMKSRKGSLIQVQFKRSTLTAMIAAEMHRLK